MKLLVAGAGGHGRVVADLAEALERYVSIAFVDDRHPELRESGPWGVIGALSDLESLTSDYDEVAVAIGDAALRLECVARAIKAGFRVPALVHPSASVSSHAVLGAGTVVCAGAVVSVGAVLGIGCIVNTNATVDHDCRLADGVHVAPGANLAGEVRVGKRTWVGIGASVRQRIAIGDDVTVGASAACVNDTPSGATVVGVPAREVSKR